MAGWTGALIDDLSTHFEAHANGKRAPQMAAYMKDRFVFFGIMAGKRRELQRKALRGTPKPSEKELERIVRACWRKKEREFQYFGADYVRAHVRNCSPRFLDALESFISTKSWWDTVDLLAIHGVGGLAREHRSVAKAMDRWIRSDDIWIARTALLFQLTYKDDTDTDKLFRYCKRRMTDGEFFIRKGMGWALREYSKTDAKAVRGFVREHRNDLSGLTQREALKWLNRSKS